MALHRRRSLTTRTRRHEPSSTTPGPPSLRWRVARLGCIRALRVGSTPTRARAALPSPPADQELLVDRVITAAPGLGSRDEVAAELRELLDAPAAGATSPQLVATLARLYDVPPRYFTSPASADRTERALIHTVMREHWVAGEVRVCRTDATTPSAETDILVVALEALCDSRRQRAACPRPA